MIRMKLQALIKKIRASYKQWNEIADHGCSDPFWEDGCNLNLIRNHIIGLKSQISEQAREEMKPVPGEVYWALPPKVPNNFMVKNGRYCQARLSNWEAERIRRLVFTADFEETVLF